MQCIKSKKSGLILVDILLAMSLGVLFVVIITQSSLSSRDLFESAKERSRLLDVYQAHENEFENMMPYERRTLILDGDSWNYSTTTISAYAHWYGNDRTQTDITVSGAQPDINDQKKGNYKSIISITFNKISNFLYENINDYAGTPLCSVYFSNKIIVGSYGFMQQISDPQKINPKISPIILPIDGTLPLTDFQVRGINVYVATDSSKISDPDIVIFDIHDISHVTLITGINTGPGIASIALAGNKIYAAVTSKIAQLQVIRMLTIDNLLIESSYKLPLPYASATPSLGSAIFYDRNVVYLGTEKWDGEEFNIIDVTNPAQPQKIGGVEINSKVEAIFVRKGIAYVTAPDEKQLRIIDVHDTANPVLLDSFSSSGWERQEGNALTFFEDTLKLGRTSGGFNIKQDHELFTWGTSTISQAKGFNVPVPNSADISGGVYGVIADRSFIYTVTRQPDRELQIYNQNLSTTTMLAISLPTLPQTMTCDADSIYVLSATSPVIYQILFK